jgi:hypothetical protein
LASVTYLGKKALREKYIMKKNILAAGTAIVDITPPLEIGLLTSSVKGSFAPFNAIRLPLKARVLALQSPDGVIVLVSLELLGLNDTVVGGWERFKKQLSGDLPPERIIITCTHTHNAPESLAFSGLYRQEAFVQWLQGLQRALKAAIKNALSEFAPISLDFGSTRLNGYSLLRRIPTAGGIVMSDSVQPVTPEWLAREPVDRRVSILRLRDASGAVLATLVHAVCHPVNEMCLPHISPDYPGELCLALEVSGTYGMVMFLNGAAGNINPLTVSEGPLAAHRHGKAIAGAVKNGYEVLAITSGLSFKSIWLSMPVRTGYMLDNPGDAVARIAVLRLGSLAMIFLPGEPFVETALEIESSSPFPHTVVVGYAENSIGYIPTEEAMREGGYEAGPGKWSFLQQGADQIILDETLHILHELNTTEYETC